MILIKACEIVTNAGAEFIKTSTGFSTAGATFDDVALMKEHVGENVKIKAAGGISSFDDAEKFISLGASRLGTSRLISSSTSSYLPSFKNPMLMTMSISDEPFAIAFFVSNTLTAVVW